MEVAIWSKAPMGSASARAVMTPAQRRGRTENVFERREAVGVIVGLASSSVPSSEIVERLLHSCLFLALLIEGKVSKGRTLDCAIELGVHRSELTLAAKEGSLQVCDLFLLVRDPVGPKCHTERVVFILARFEFLLQRGKEGDLLDELLLHGRDVLGDPFCGFHEVAGSVVAVNAVELGVGRQ